MEKIRFILILTVFQFCFFKTSVAQVEQSQLIGAYIYNFAQYTTWPNESELELFTIVLISSNENIINEFRSFAQKKVIKDKPVNLKIFSTFSDQLPDTPQMVLLTEENSPQYEKLYQWTNERPILVVSQNLMEKRDVMINLYLTPDNALVFEVNKANIINHKLILDPEVLLLGGTEIDVAELYRNSQKSIVNLQDKLITMSDSFMLLNKKISSTLNLLNEQNLKVIKQDSLLERQEKELQSGNEKLQMNLAEIEDKQQKIRQQTALIIEREKSINGQKEQLEERQKYISQQEAEIEKSKLILDSLTIEITSKNNIVGEQDLIIKRQKLAVILAIALGLIFLFMLIIIFIGYRNNSRSNKLLIEQKGEIEKINRALKESNTTLFNAIAKLKETQSQLVNSEKMASLGVLTAGIAHEINNPVNFIYTGINILQRDMDDLLSVISEIEQIINEKARDELLEQIEKIRDERELEEIVDIIEQTIQDIKVGAERTTEIVKGLRNFSRMDKDNKQLYNIHEGLDSSLLLLKNKYKNHIEVEKDYTELPPVECFAGKLNQVFVNIIGNAIDAMPKGGKIRISTYKNESNVCVDIGDTGVGISSEIIDKIFDPFFSTKTVGEGVGLGLSISFGIIEEHKGKISVKSEPNIGTTFTISLPYT